MADSMIYMQNYINGALVAPVSGSYLDSFQPSTGRVFAKVSRYSLLLCMLIVIRYRILILRMWRMPSPLQKLLIQAGERNPH